MLGRAAQSIPVNPRFFCILIVAEAKRVKYLSVVKKYYVLSFDPLDDFSVGLAGGALFGIALLKNGQNDFCRSRLEASINRKVFVVADK